MSREYNNIFHLIIIYFFSILVSIQLIGFTYLSQSNRFIRLDITTVKS